MFNDVAKPIRNDVLTMVQGYMAAHPDATPDVVAQDVATHIDLSGFNAIVPDVEAALSGPVTDGGEAMVARLQIKPFEFDQIDTAAVTYAKARAAELVGMQYDALGQLAPNPDADMAITDSTRNKIRELVVRSLSVQEGEPLVLKDAIAALSDDIDRSALFSKDRAALIAQAEAGMAHNFGRLAALHQAEATGLVLEKGWSTAKDAKVCSEICGVNALAGFIPLNAYFPSGHMAPLGHPRCRCALIGKVKH